MVDLLIGWNSVLRHTIREEQRQLNHFLEFTMRPYYYQDIAWLNLVNSWSHISERIFASYSLQWYFCYFACSFVCVEAPIDYQFKAVREKHISTTLLTFQILNDLLHVLHITNQCCLFFSKRLCYELFARDETDRSPANGTVHARLRDC